MSDMDLQLRKVDIDFSDAKIHWNAAGPEFSHIFNAFSLTCPSLEPFLIKTMRHFKEQVPESNTQLRRDIDLFNSQEGRHYRMHMKFNKVLHAAGYETAEAEAKLKADYERFTTKKGLKFCLAYSEGFETLGPALSGYFFDRSPELPEGWDEATTYLWLWHVAEEYEHRAVVNSTYKLLYDDHWYRLYGLWFALIHLFSFVLRVGNQMTNQDLAQGRIQGRVRSRLRLIRALAGLCAYAFPRLIINAQKRSYDPTRLPPMKNAMALLEDVSQRYGLVEHS